MLADEVRALTPGGDGPPIIEALRERALAAITGAEAILGQLPPANVMDDDCGGVRAEWESGGYVVLSVVEGEPYIYHQFGDEYGTCEVSAENLAKWLGELDHGKTRGGA